MPSDILTADQIAEIKARREAITPTPWTGARLCGEDGKPYGVDEFATYVRGCAEVSGGTDFLAVLSDGHGDVCHTGNGPNGPANTHFIERAPTDIDALLASHAALAERLESARSRDETDYGYALAHAYENGLRDARSGEQTLDLPEDPVLPNGLDDGLPLCRFGFFTERGDPSVGIDGWSGWIMTPNQDGTVFAALLAEVESLRERVAALEDACDSFRDAVLNQRGLLAENGMTSDQVNDVLGEFDAAIDAARKDKP